MARTPSWNEIKIAVNTRNKPTEFKTAINKQNAKKSISEMGSFKLCNSVANTNLCLNCNIYIVTCSFYEGRKEMFYLTMH